MTNNKTNIMNNFAKSVGDLSSLTQILSKSIETTDSLILKAAQQMTNSYKLNNRQSAIGEILKNIAIDRSKIFSDMAIKHQNTYSQLNSLTKSINQCDDRCYEY